MKENEKIKLIHKLGWIQGHAQNNLHKQYAKSKMNRSRSLDTDERKYNLWNMMPINKALNEMQRLTWNHKVKIEQSGLTKIWQTKIIKQCINATLCIDLNTKDALIRIQCMECNHQNVMQQSEWKLCI